MEERHIIAIYCRFSNDDKIKNTDNYSQMFPEYVINRINKASEVYSRIISSHPDKEYIKIIFFGQKPIELLKNYGMSIGLPEEKIGLDNCKDISAMAKKIWMTVKDNNATPRVYFIASNWQWIYLVPLISVKDTQYQFYFEGAIDERHPDKIEMDKMMERVTKINLNKNRLANVLDKVGTSLSENLKG